MSNSLRERRMQSEWLLLLQLAEANPEILVRVEREPDAFLVQLAETPGWVAGEDRPVVVREHLIRYVFPRYYPALPLEAYCRRAPLHPNAHPENGFLCLWVDYAPNRSIVDALLITRAMLAHRASNRSEQHCMQPAAHDLGPLVLPELKVPEGCRTAAGAPGGRRTRLTSIQDDNAHPQSALAISHPQ
jgi:hypothetical protein